MSRNLDSTSKLTEFAPLSPEVKQSGVGNLISKLFKLSKNEQQETTHLQVPNEYSPSPSQESSDGRCSPQLEMPSSENDSPVHGPRFPVDVAEGRSLPNVLKRISNLLALKSVGLQAYRDTDLKQYWMPDSVSRECYDCGERFTTFRRRHHCRICGQIFCSRCCSQEVPGKIVGCTDFSSRFEFPDPSTAGSKWQGDLRVCTYCCKVVLSYLQSADISADLSADLRALQEDLQSKFGSNTSLATIGSIQTPGGGGMRSAVSSSLTEREESGLGTAGPSPGAYTASVIRRKHSLGYQEERFAQGRDQAVSDPLPEEERNWTLCALREELGRPGHGLPLRTIRQRLRVYHGVFMGSELINWLLDHGKAGDREQGFTISQALVDGGFLECVSDTGFLDSCALYRLAGQGVSEDSLERCGSGEVTDNSNSGQDGQEPSWVKDVPHRHHDSTTTTDSESECVVPENEPDDNRSLPSSSSNYQLDMNVHKNTVHLVRPQPSSPASSVATSSAEWMQSQASLFDTGLSSEFLNYAALLHTSQNTQNERPIPWHQITPMRSDNGDLQAYTALNEAFSQHERGLLTQLLNSEGLPQSWTDIVLPLVHQVANTVRPDTTNDAEDMDVRQYIQFKKVPGGSRSECEIVNGIVCTKNVVHRSMSSCLPEPRILLLNCAIVYQRVEGRLLSLEPAMMQEQEYLRRVVARIEALKPDLILVSRNVSRLAQESLRMQGVTFALNVKLSVLERVARCTQAHIVTSVDAHIGQPQLGTCKSFYLRTFNTERGGTKTLMFLEGCPQPHLGCTVILRGGNHSELSRLKRVLRHMIFSRYHWRLELSFLMDEQAQPPNVTCDSFFEDSSFSQPEKSPSKLPPRKESDAETSDTVNFVNESFGLGKRSSTLDEEYPVVLPKRSTISSVDAASGTFCSSTPHALATGETAFSFSQDTNMSEHEHQEKQKAHLRDSQESVLQSVTLRNRRLNSNSDQPDALRRVTGESISDFSDPLHQYLTLSEEESKEQSTEEPGSNQQLAVAKMPFLNYFRKALDDMILSSSPYLKFTVPFLETEPGRSCELRQYFPDEIFWSRQFDKGDGVRSRLGTANESFSHSLLMDSDYYGIKMAPKHPYMEAKLTSPSNSLEVQEMLAHFRACGSRISPTSCSQPIGPRTPPPASTSIQGDPSLDVLDAYNHQHLSVLFCSFSPASQNAPAFCVNPWVVKMDFYGGNDIPLGNFLERYCFRASYECPSGLCSTPMLQHTRRFVHYPGCVQVSLRLVEGSGPLPTSGEILMWSRCSLCNAVSSVVPMSPDTWSLSFSKYLELRFYGDMYRLRSGKNERVDKASQCSHSLHHHHYQHFGFRNIVASFKYSPILVWEVSLPPQLVTLEWETTHLKCTTEEIGQIAVSGQQVFSQALERLCDLAAEEPGVANLKSQLQKDQAQFKAKVDDALAVTPPSSKAEQCQLLWRLEDAVVELMRSVLEAVGCWNTRLQALEQRPRSVKASFSFLPETADGVASQPSASLDQDDTDKPIVHEGVVSPGTRMEGGSLNAPLSAGNMDLGDSESSVEYSGSDKQESLDQSQNQKEAENQLCELGEQHQHTGQQPQTTSGVQLHCQRRSCSSDQETEGQLDPGEYLVINSTELPTQLPLQTKSVKTILSQLLPSAPAMTSVLVPPKLQEVHIMPRGSATVPIAVRESQPSSIIAHALSSHDYRRNLDEMLQQKSQPEITSSVIPPQAPKKTHTTGDRERDRDSLNGELTQSTELRRTGVLSFLRSAPNTSAREVGNIESVAYCTGSGHSAVSYSTGISAGGGGCGSSLETSSNISVGPPNPPQPNSQSSTNYIEVLFSDTSTNFYCRIYFAEEFKELRRLVWPSGEEGFVRSLAHCVQWAARGGKSGSTFCKSRDDRLVLKEMSRLELTLFLERAPRYFQYITQSHKERRPTLLGKILGVFRVVFKNDVTGNALRSTFLAMENLFYGREVSHRFDLKGSVRNRMVNPGSEPRGEIVLLDENLLKLTRDNPLYVLPHSKTVLSQAIQNDTEFLAAQSVMDYSLLVGLDETRKELVVGIIDYIRTFTWDKRLETVIKKLGGQGKAPTILQPEAYQKRFIAAMNSYFLTAPDRWYGFGRGFEI